VYVLVEILLNKKFGDVIVGNQMIEYAHVRDSGGENNIQHRGVITASGTRLFLKFKGQAFWWRNENKPIDPYHAKAEEISQLSEYIEENPSMKVFDGPILSGPELIDNAARAKELVFLRRSKNRQYVWQKILIGLSAAL